MSAKPTTTPTRTAVLAYASDSSYGKWLEDQPTEGIQLWRNPAQPSQSLRDGMACVDTLVFNPPSRLAPYRVLVVGRCGGVQLPVGVGNVPACSSFYRSRRQYRNCRGESAGTYGNRSQQAARWPEHPQSKCRTHFRSCEVEVIDQSGWSSGDVTRSRNGSCFRWELGPLASSGSDPDLHSPQLRRRQPPALSSQARQLYSRRQHAENLLSASNCPPSPWPKKKTTARSSSPSPSSS